MTQIQTTTMQSCAASLAIALTGAVWGVYWLPLRYLEGIGLSGSWATAAFFIVAIPAALLLAVLARHEIRTQLRTFLWLAVFNGLVFNLYSNAYTLTTVFNVLFLFYLSPIWSILIARFWFKERASAVRIGCVVAGLAGLVTMLSGDGGWPLPRNLGDWMALASGVLWALVTIRIRNSPEFGTASNSVAFFIGGLVLALIFAILLGSSQFPTPGTITAAWPLVLFVSWIVWVP